MSKPGAGWSYGRVVLLEAEGFDGGDAGGFAGGVDAEDDADCGETPTATITDSELTIVYHSATRAMRFERTRPNAMPSSRRGRCAFP